MAGDFIEARGKVLQARGNAMFLVELDFDGKHSEIVCTISGSIRKNNIRIQVGDFVSVKLSPYDLDKGIITYRHRG